MRQLPGLESTCACTVGLPQSRPHHFQRCSSQLLVAESASSGFEWLCMCTALTGPFAQLGPLIVEVIGVRDGRRWKLRPSFLEKKAQELASLSDARLLLQHCSTANWEPNRSTTHHTAATGHGLTQGEDQ